ncbi:MAG TPA: DUF3883 domain-containing protein [Xanthobacteraceae bacterium]|nr:DUF3883 domain-containing protein [Xanthobacteraceae bacterium]
MAERAQKRPSSIRLGIDPRSHIPAVLWALLRNGWRIIRGPESGRIARNGQLVVLSSGDTDLRLRVFVYKVTGSSRGKAYERRVEITSTYPKGNLRKLNDYSDVVFGYDEEKRIFVGIDPRRVEHGGKTGNASSFFDREGLTWREASEISVRERPAALFPEKTEFHAFMKPGYVAEYLFNMPSIHNGSYVGRKLRGVRSDSGSNSPLTAPELGSDETLVLKAARRTVGEVDKPPQGLVQAYEASGLEGLRRRKISPTLLAKIKRYSEENGSLGEEHALESERRRLIRAGRSDLAQRVIWVSQLSISEGYDILSFEIDGTQRFIEVKATSGRNFTFEMSHHEWKTCCRKGERYFIYRVTQVRDNPRLRIVPNPSRLESRGALRKSPSGWLVRLL